MIKIQADMAEGTNGSNIAFNSQLYPQELWIKEQAEGKKKHFKLKNSRNDK